MPHQVMVLSSLEILQSLVAGFPVTAARKLGNCSRRCGDYRVFEVFEGLEGVGGVEVFKEFEVFEVFDVSEVSKGTKVSKGFEVFEVFEASKASKAFKVSISFVLPCKFCQREQHVIDISKLFL